MSKPLMVATAAQIAPEQYLTFSLCGEVYAMGILHIKEIIEYHRPTTVPLMPESIHGVINLRGAVVPVIDLAVRFGRGLSQISRRSCIVILELGQGEVRQDLGLIVDSVSEVVEIRADDIEPPPSFGTRLRTEFIQGMGRINERLVIMLNVGRVFNLDEFADIARLADSSSETAPVAA